MKCGGRSASVCKHKGVQRRTLIVITCGVSYD
jgi:hypothetical protein